MRSPASATARVTLCAAPAAGASKGRLALPALLAGACVIGSAPIFVRLSEVGPTVTAFYRLLLALPLLWTWAAWEVRRGRSALLGGAAPRLFGAGLFFALDLALWHRSIHYTSVANATLLANLAPVFVALGAWWLFGESLSRRFVVGFGCGLLGLLLLTADSAANSHEHLLGDGLATVTAVFYAGYLLAVSRLRRRLTTAAVMAWSGTATCAALLPLALLSGEAMLPITATGWTILLGLALLSHVAGQSLIAYALAHLPATFSSVSLLLQPVVAAALGWVVLSEALHPVQGLGAALVLTGISLARRGNAAPEVAAPQDMYGARSSCGRPGARGKAGTLLPDDNR